MWVVANPPRDRPLMVFDGDCGFCRCWIERWRRSTGHNVNFGEAQHEAARFPEIPASAFADAVQFIETNGQVSSGADAVFRAFDYARNRRGFLRKARHWPGVLPIARAIYGFVARHRMLFSVLTRPWCRRRADEGVTRPDNAS